MPKFFATYLRLLVTISALAITNPGWAQTYSVSGDVSGTWTSSNSPYYISGNISVPSGSTLTISSGVEVRFQGNYEFFVYGTLSAQGAEGDSIYFVQDSPSDSLWGGIRLYSSPSSSSIKYCRIENSFADNGGSWNDGGAVRISNSSPTIEHCYFKNNKAKGNGGALYLYISNALIQYCTIDGDSAGNYGGAIHMDTSAPTVKNCKILNNKGFRGGGIHGAYFRAGTDISNNTFKYNEASDNGGGIYFHHSNPLSGIITFDGNLIEENIGKKGGGIYILYSSALTLTNNIIINNSTTTEQGGGIGIRGGTSTTLIVNNTIYGNSAKGGGGIYSYDPGSPVQVKNSVIWGNTATSGADQVDTNAVGSIDLSYCDIEDGYTGMGNINIDPVFTDVSSGDFHYEANSPLVDAGNNTDAPSTDYDGNSRPFDGDRDLNTSVDIGAFEYQNTAPQINSIAVKFVNAGESYNYDVNATDDDIGEVLTYSLTQAPSFLSINGSSGIISGMPTYDDDGDHEIIVQVADLNGATDSQNYTLTVNTDQALPVFLSSFEANQQHETIYLEWKTESELNNLGFDIYRAESTDNVLPSEEIFTKINDNLVQGVGNSSVQNLYTYTDENIKDGYYYWYKLEDIDIEGHATMHNAISVYKEPIASNFYIKSSYPNPFNSEIVVEFYLPTASNVNLIIFNSGGQVVENKRPGLYPRGTNRFKWLANGVASGIYYMRIATQKDFGITKLILLK